MSSPTIAPSRSARSILPALGAAGLAALLIAVNVRKGLWVGIQGWGRPYWWLDYHQGFVRRGLVGEVFQALFGRLSETQLIIPIGWETRLCLTAIAAVFLVQLYKTLRAQSDPRRTAAIVAVALCGAASQFWSTLAYNQGYLDSLVITLAAVAVLLMRARLYWAVAACLAVGPFIHEYFCFLIPFILASDRILPGDFEAHSKDIVGFENDRPSAKIGRHLLWLTAVAVVAAAVVILLPNAEAARREIAAMPISPQDRGILMKVTLTQTLSQSLNDCLGYFFGQFGFTLKNLLFFAWPALLATGAQFAWTGGRPNAAVMARAAAGLFPLCALALAWDLSRLLVMADFTAVMLFLITARDIAPAPARGGVTTGGWWAALAAAAVLAFGYLLLPLAYVYYEPGPATLFTATEGFGLGKHVFGAQHLWRYSVVSSLSQLLPSDQKTTGPHLLHELSPVIGVTRRGVLGWRIAALPKESLVVYGPYIDLKPGPYRTAFRLRPQHRSAACARPDLRIDVIAAETQKLAASPAKITSSANCVWTVSADLQAPAGGATAVQTYLFMKSPEPMMLDGYTLEPAPAQSR